VSCDDRRLATGSYDGKIGIWDIDDTRSTSYEKIRECDFDSNSFVLNTKYHPSSSSKVLGSNSDGLVCEFDVGSGSQLNCVQAHKMAVQGLDYSPIDGNLFVTSSHDGEIHLYDTRSSHLINVFSGHGSWVTNVKFCDNKHFVSWFSSIFFILISIFIFISYLCIFC